MRYISDYTNRNQCWYRNKKMCKWLTLSSRVSFTALPLCDQVNIGSGKPETSHSNFIFCPALAITLERGTTNAGDSVGSSAVKGVNFLKTSSSTFKSIDTLSWFSIFGDSFYIFINSSCIKIERIHNVAVK